MSGAVNNDMNEAQLTAAGARKANNAANNNNSIGSGGALSTRQDNSVATTIRGGDSNNNKKKKKTIVFIHPDLGIGGAERLVVDAAVGLQEQGHKVVVYTSWCDEKHCFEEARDGTLDVRVRGNFLIPSSLFGRFSILCAILRQTLLILQVRFTRELHKLAVETKQPTVFFVDQLSAGLPLLTFLYPTTPILFYCHYPDLLLVKDRKSLASWWRRVYRWVFDGVEGWSMKYADAIAVNSEFTRGVVLGVWPALKKGGWNGSRERELGVVYPCIGAGVASGQDGSIDDGSGEKKSLAIGGKEGGKILLSINRFEKKKDVALAIKAFAGLSEQKRKGARLVIAGGYDSRVAENVSYHAELVNLAESLGLRTATTSTVVTALALLHNNVVSSPQTTTATTSDTASSAATDVQVLFLLSIPTALKQTLLSSASLLLYTPSNEHFGIVPLEAMQAGVPVLAANNGGPTETILDGETGWLRDPEDVSEWTKVVDHVLNGMSDSERSAMREAGQERVKSGFGRDQMAGKLDGGFDEMLEEVKNYSRQRLEGGTVFLVGFLVTAVCVIAADLVIGLVRRGRLG